MTGTHRPNEVRLRHSVMFTPGTRPDRIEKALEAGAADVVVADLEDAVAPEDKESARVAVTDAFRAGKQAARAERCVRINAPGTRWTVDDVTTVMAAPLDAIVVPKVERRAFLEALDARLSRLERAHGRPRGSTAVHIILETAAGVLDAAALARCPRVEAVYFGAEDLAADARLVRSPTGDEVAHARAHVALAAAAARVDPIDQVFVDIDSVDGLRREAQVARSLGYRGKMVIHPRQIEPVHGAFAPTADEVDRATRLLAAVDESAIRDGGVLRFEGRMVDVPLVEQARRVVREAEAANRR